MTGRERFLRFLLSGGVAAAVNWLSRILFSQWLDYGMAVTLAFFCGMFTGFVLFRLFVFGAGKNPLTHSVGYYVLINVAALGITWSVSVGLGLHLFPAIGMTLYPLEIAHATGIVAPTIASYFGHKLLTFR